jgi:protein-S-isoprenylcysteine O-methyltransferase Ste14
MTKYANPPTALPKSDVSSLVGLVGLVTLLGWIAFARAWPALAGALALPNEGEVLSGPNSALLAMVLTGFAMAAWSLLVDKVHRRPSTGIDWAHPRPLAAVREISVTKLTGLWITWLVIGAFYALGRWYWDGQYLFAMRVLAWCVVPLLVLSVPYVLWLDRYLKEPRDGAWHFGAMLIGREPWDSTAVKRHWRAWMIKAFFGAFMISILPGGFAAVVETDFTAITTDPVRLGGALFELLFVIDVQIGTVGYLLTMRPLDAHIRSGNPFLAGWVAALLCYPPVVFGFMGEGGMLQYEYQTAAWGHWFAGHEALLWVWAALLVTLTGIYAWATVAFGLRFSNLTYRGVLTHGPYRFTRHPAYLSKNLFWWCSVMPFMVTSHSPAEALRNTVLLACVSGIYFWRAMTEEAHLLAEDPKYRAYHAWMGAHGLITAPLARLSARLRSGAAPAHAQPEQRPAGPD